MISPAFSLDFTTATLDQRVSLTRSGNTATRVNSSGLIEVINANLPRFDYDPVTLACRGLLVEEARTNVVVGSEEFGGSWTKTNTTIADNTTASPGGTNTADTFAETTANATHSMFASAATNVTSGVTYTQSVFIKAGTISVIQLTFGSAQFGTDAFANYDVANGIIGTVGSASTARIKPYKNGFYRLELTATATATTTSAPCVIVFCNNNLSSGRAPSYAGSTASNVFVWGGQFETGAFATSYIPTTSAALTRNADVATITGTAFSDWWQATRGGVLVRARPDTVSGVRPWLQFDDGTVNEIIALRGNTTNPELYIVDGGTPQAQIDAGTIAANTDYSLTGWWATNDCKARLDGGAVVTDTSATIPTVTQARLGSDGTNYLNGHLASISYYDSFSEQIYTRRKNKAVFNLM